MFIPSVIKSVQRATLSLPSGVTSQTYAITAVTLANARLRLLGVNSNDTGVTNVVNCVRIELTSSTVITASRQDGTATDLIISYEVVEYFPGLIKSIQRGTIDMLNSISVDGTITAVVMAKTEVDFLGSETANLTNDFTYMEIHLSSTTKVTCTRSNGDLTPSSIAGYQVIEWR